MFPVPSPGSALFNTNLGLSTPSGLDFLRTGISAKSATNGLGPTSQPTEAPTSQGMDLKMPAAQSSTYDPGHADTDAANGLFMLAQSNGARQTNGFQSQQTSHASSSAANQAHPAPTQGRNGNKASIGSISTHMDDLSDSDQSEEVTKPTTRSRGKKQASEAKAAPNNRRKATDSAGKPPSAKRARGNTAQDKAPSSPLEDEEEEPTHKDGRKMNDEEKRKNFLERNR
jgi:ATF/CREB family transcription factor